MFKVNNKEDRIIILIIFSDLTFDHYEQQFVQMNAWLLIISKIRIKHINTHGSFYEIGLLLLSVAFKYHRY